MTVSKLNFSLKYSILYSSFLFLLFFASSCKKEDSGLGLDALNSEDLLDGLQTDTFTLKTFTILEDSVISDNSVSAVLGSYNDPKFGLFNASFYTQLHLAGLNPNFGTGITIDSTVLGLEYSGYYGNLSAQTFEVYQLTETLHIDSTYYSFTNKNTNSINLVEPGFETIIPKPNTKTIIGTDTVDAQLRIRIKNSFAQKIIDDANMGASDFSSNSNFVNYMKGLHVKTNNGSQTNDKGGILYFNLNDPLSKLTIYYTQDGNKKRFDLLINNECADFNHVDINNTGKPIQNVVNDTISGQTEFYAQAFGHRAVVQIPGLSNIPKKSIIHKATLILPTQYQTGSKYAPSFEISAAKKLNNRLSSIGVFGIYDDFKKQYTVDIKTFLQELNSGQISSTELYLSPRFFVNSAERIIFNGSNTINKKKPQLVITYTEF